jgi:hypothetical protein
LLDDQWLAYLASGGDIGDGMSLPNDNRFVTAIDRLNDGGYFEAHELFEQAWQAAAYPERLLCLALSKLGAAFEQQQRGRLNGARKIVRDAQHCLHPLPAVYGSIDIEALRNDLSTWSAKPGSSPLLKRISVN